MTPFQGDGSALALLLAFEREIAMEDKPKSPGTLPFVPAPTHSLAANIVYTFFYAGNGAITLEIAEERSAPVQRIGDTPIAAAFEIARYTLTPRSLRQLQESIEKTIKAYEESVGTPLPKIHEFMARGAMTTLPPMPPPQTEPPKPKPDGGPEAS